MLTWRAIAWELLGSSGSPWIAEELQLLIRWVFNVSDLSMLAAVLRQPPEKCNFKIVQSYLVV